MHTHACMCACTCMIERDFLNSQISLCISQEDFGKLSAKFCYGPYSRVDVVYNAMISEQNFLQE